MELHYSGHARKRMEERGISPEDVEQALRRAIGPPDAGEPGSVWVRGFAMSGRILKVCLRSDDRSFVITAVWEESEGT